MDDETGETPTPTTEPEAPELAKPAPFRVNEIQTKNASGLTTREGK
jgi:hypothetical protein